MEICKKCILTDSFPSLTFENGICSFCSNWQNFTKANKPVKGAENLLKLLKSKPTKEYDCLVPISGGKDSGYILYCIVKQLGLKPLAAYFDNGFASDVAKRNVEILTKKLCVDLVVGHATKYRIKLVKEALYACKYLNKFLKSICANCENNNRTFTLNEAKRRQIPFIIWGSTDFEDPLEYFTSVNSKSFREGFGSDVRIINPEKIKKLKALLQGVSFRKKLLAFYHICRYMYYCTRDNISSGTPGGLKRLYPFYEVSFRSENVEAVYFYQYIKYNPEAQSEVLIKETGWSALPKGDIKIDCNLHSFQDYQRLKDTGTTATGELASILVRNGLLNREVALERENKNKEGLHIECAKVCQDLNINIDIGFHDFGKSGI